MDEPPSTPLRGRKRRVASAVARTLMDLLQAGCPGTLAGLLGEQRAAYADMHNALGTVARLRVCGRLIMEDVENEDRSDDTPSQALAQDEIKRTSAALTLTRDDATWALGEVTTDDEGYIDHVVDVGALGLAPGLYGVELREPREGGALLGRCSARLLAEDHSAPVVRSDVDLTYLLTDFQSSTGLAGLLVSNAAKREALPAMEEVYRALRAGSSGEDDRPLVFLSGSPRFFKRTLEAKMAMDAVFQDGLVLKPFKDIVADNLLKLAPHEVMGDLKEQLGYKLHALLRLRLELPASTPEVLMGDDSEADVVIYTLYHRLTSGALDAAAFVAQLVELGVAETWRALIEPLAGEVHAHVGASAPVQAIYINRTGCAGPHAARVEDHLEGGLVRYHSGAWPLVLDLFEHGWVGQAGVEAVRARLLALGLDAEALGATAQAGVNDGFLSPWTVTLFDPARTSTT